MLNALLYSLFRTMMYLLWRAHNEAEGEARIEAMGYINRLDDDWSAYNRSQR